MSEFYRALFSCAGEADIVVDLAIDSDLRWIDFIPCGGWLGKMNSSDVLPFVLTSGGKVDFGHIEGVGSMWGERYAWLDIAEKWLITGERYRFQHLDVNLAYRLTSLTKHSALMELVS